MDGQQIYDPSYKGSRRFTQWDVSTANATGFGAAADDYAERGIDLNEQLIKNKPATFFMRVTGDAMVNAGIFHGDILIVDRSLKASNGKIIVAVLNGEMLVRRFEKALDRIRLIPETNRLSAIEVDAGCADFDFWGVVTYVIHAV